MKILFLNLAILLTFSATAQKKSTSTKNNSNSTNSSKTVSASQLNQQYDNDTVNVVTKNEKVENITIVEEKYKFIIYQNASKIKEVEDKLTAKKNDYIKVDKLKNINSINTDIKKARVDMLSEFLGKEVAAYYLEQNKYN
jgi:hypothetical protein